MSDELAFDDEDIPADIRAKARAMLAESQAHPGIWSAKDTVARAIAIERERCAKIAEYDADMWVGENGAAACIAVAAAIRRGSS